MIISKKRSLSAQKKEEMQKDSIWALNIKHRDGNACLICGNKYVPNAHHIIDRGNRAYRWDEDNGVTLCVYHHKFSRLISAHNAPFAFLLWLKKYRWNQFAIAEGRIVESLIGEIALDRV